MCLAYKRCRNELGFDHDPFLFFGFGIQDEQSEGSSRQSSDNSCYARRKSGGAIAPSSLHEAASTNRPASGIAAPISAAMNPSWTSLLLWTEAGRHLAHELRSQCRRRMLTCQQFRHEELYRLASLRSRLGAIRRGWANRKPQDAPWFLHSDETCDQMHLAPKTAA